MERPSAGQGLPAFLKIAPGGTARGYLVFEVPKAAKIVSVQFSLGSGLRGDGGVEDRLTGWW